MHRAARRQTGRKSLTACATCPGVTPMPFFRRKPPNGGLQKRKLESAAKKLGFDPRISVEPWEMR